MSLKRLLGGVLSVSILALALPASAEDPITLNFTTGSKGLNYYKYGTRVGELVGLTSNLVLNVTDSKGTGNNVELYTSGAADLFTGQVEAENMTDATVVATMWDDYAHLVCRIDKIPEDADEVGELRGDSRIGVGIAPGSGSKLAFDAFQAVDPYHYGNEVFRVLPLDVRPAVQTMLEGNLPCVFFVAGLNSDYAKLLDKPQYAGVLTFVEIDEGGLDDNGYKWVQIDEDVYPNLLNGSDFDTVAVPSKLYVRPGFENDHPIEFLALESAAQQAATEFRKNMQNPG